MMPIGRWMTKVKGRMWMKLRVRMVTMMTVVVSMLLPLLMMMTITMTLTMTMMVIVMLIIHQKTIYSKQKEALRNPYNRKQ